MDDRKSNSLGNKYFIPTKETLKDRPESYLLAR